ncbi:MOSC domain containing protein [hydrothermal vent metagenome]|uniref:MOSC domain containing protein n=1 Tax=hydrothermal vent metagenome TaxID=652676 RepID=A0A3B0XR06_9ZZZZ
MTDQTISELIKHIPQKGRVEWIGIRHSSRSPMVELEKVIVVEAGLRGDHYAGKSGKRSVTLIQYEHITALGSLLQRKPVDYADLRRNIVISGINLLALKDREFRIGRAVLKMTGLCHPCSRMEEVLGEGGYNALRGHGGINACVISQGEIQLNDELIVI